MIMNKNYFVVYYLKFNTMFVAECTQVHISPEPFPSNKNSSNTDK
jgi:hypothetical protein